MLDYLNFDGFFTFDRHDICAWRLLKLGLPPVAKLSCSFDCGTLTLDCTKDIKRQAILKKVLLPI